MTNITKEWTPCTHWADVPSGTWLVKLEGGRAPYHVAEVHHFKHKGSIITVGGAFSFDRPNILGYSGFTEYNPNLTPLGA